MNTSVVSSTSEPVTLQKLKLPTISEQGMKALEIINVEDLKFNELESALSADPMLTGILLKYANSPMYRKFVEITDVRKAINLLGVDIVKSAILICTMRSYCNPTNPAKEMLWEKSIHFSIMAKLVARKAYRRFADAIELSAMMSQIGGLVLSSNFVEGYSVVVDNTEKNNSLIEEEELKYFGLSRADVTAYALEKLRLPQDIITALTLYYQGVIPSEIETKADMHVVTLTLASLLINDIDNKTESEIKSKPDVISLMEALGLVDSDIDDFVDTYNEKVSEGFSF